MFVGTIQPGHQILLDATQGESKGIVCTTEIRPAEGWEDIRSLQGTLVLTRLKPGVVKITQEDIRNMDVPSLQDIWKVCLNCTSSYFMQYCST